MVSILATRATHVEGPQVRQVQFKDLTLIKKVAVIFATAIEALLYTVTLGCLFPNPKVYFNRLVTWMTPEVRAEALRDPNPLAIVPYTGRQIPDVDMLHVKAEEIFARTCGPLEMRLFAQEQRAQALAIVPYRQWEKRAAPEATLEEIGVREKELQPLLEKLKRAKNPKEKGKALYDISGHYFKVKNYQSCYKHAGLAAFEFETSGRTRPLNVCLQAKKLCKEKDPKVTTPLSQKNRKSIVMKRSGAHRTNLTKLFDQIAAEKT